jgi:hypothetical protein
VFDKRHFIEGMNGCKRAGDTVFVPFNGLEPRELRAQVNAALHAWCLTHGTEAAIIEENGDGVVCVLSNIKAGSPKRSRSPVQHPWFYMEVGDTRFAPQDKYPPSSLRVYVSQFCAKLGQKMTVSVAKGGCNIKRIK